MGKADDAVRYVLDRAQTDPDLGYLIGTHTQAFEMLCAAEAEASGEDLEALKERRAKNLRPHMPRSMFRLGAVENAVERALEGVEPGELQWMIRARDRITELLREDEE